jgi:hypothetical protein
MVNFGKSTWFGEVAVGDVAVGEVAVSEPDVIEKRFLRLGAPIRAKNRHKHNEIPLVAVAVSTMSHDSL